MSKCNSLKLTLNRPSSLFIYFSFLSFCLLFFLSFFLSFSIFLSVAFFLSFFLFSLFLSFWLRSCCGSISWLRWSCCFYHLLLDTYFKVMFYFTFLNFKYIRVLLSHETHSISAKNKIRFESNFIFAFPFEFKYNFVEGKLSVRCINSKWRAGNPKSWKRRGRGKKRHL